MRVLPHVVIPALGSRLLRVTLLGLTLLGLTLLGLTGCSQFDKALGQQQALVSFSQGTPDSVRLQVRAVCGKLPHVVPAPLPKGVPLSSAVSEVVFSVSSASDADIARLQECVQKFPAVAGIDLQDSSDDS